MVIGAEHESARSAVAAVVRDRVLPTVAACGALPTECGVFGGAELCRRNAGFLVERSSADGMRGVSFCGRSMSAVKSAGAAVVRDSGSADGWLHTELCRRNAGGFDGVELC